MVLTSINFDDFFDRVRLIIQEEIAKSQSSNFSIQSKPATTKELMEFLGITEPTVIKWKKKGKIPFMQVGESVRFDLQKVVEALEVDSQNKKSISYNSVYKKDKIDNLDPYYLRANLRRKGFKDDNLLTNPKVLEMTKASLQLKREIKKIKQHDRPETDL